MNRNSSAQEASVKVSAAVIGCLILIVSFFLPWVKIFGENVPGYEIGRLSSDWQWLWAIPIVSGAAVLLGMSGKRHVEIAQIAGALPLVGLGLGLYRLGRDLFPALLFGGWCALASGVFLVSIAPRLGHKPDQTSTPEASSPGGDNQ